MFERFGATGIGDAPHSRHLKVLARMMGRAVLLAQLASLFSLIFPGCWLSQPFGSVWDMVNEAGIRVPMGGIVLVMGVAYAADSRARMWFARVIARRSFRIAIAALPGAALPLVALLRAPVLAALFLMLLMIAFLPNALLLVRWIRDLKPSELCGTGCLALVCTAVFVAVPAGTVPLIALGTANALALGLHLDAGDMFKLDVPGWHRKKRRTGDAWPILAAALLLFGVMLVYCVGVRDAAAESYSTWLPWRSGDYLSLWSGAVGLLLAGAALMRPGVIGWRNRLLAAAPALLLLAFVVAIRIVLPGALSTLVPSLFVLVVLAVIGLLCDRATPNSAACDSFVKACVLGAVVGMAGIVPPNLLSMSQSDSAMPSFMLLTGATFFVIMALLWGERVACRLVHRRRVAHITDAADLSHREDTVVVGILAGESLGSLADRLGISRSTVSTYAQRAYHKLGVRDQAGLIELVQERSAYRPCMNPRCFSVGWSSTAFPLGMAGAYLCGFGLHEVFAYELFKPHILAWIAGFPVLKLLVTPGAAACAFVVLGALACGWGLRGSQRLSGKLLLALVACGVVGWATGELVLDWLLVHIDGRQRRLLGGMTLVVGCTLVLLQVVRDGRAMRLLCGGEDEACAALTTAAGLTVSEAAIALMLARGMCPSSIAEQLVVSPHTVETHRKRIYAKLGIHCQDEVASALWSRMSRQPGRQPGGTGDIGW